MKYAIFVSDVAHQVQAFESDPGAPWVQCGDIGPGWIRRGALTVPPPSTVVPAEITMQQARQVIHAVGLSDQVELAIEAMEEPGRTKARIAWEYSNMVQRHNGFVSLLAPLLNLTDDQVDAMFIAGAAIP